MSDGVRALRVRLEALDDALVDLLVARAALVGEVWELKDRLGVPRLDLGREQGEIERMVARAVAAGLDPDGVRAVVARIVGHDLEHGRRPRGGT